MPSTTHRHISEELLKDFFEALSNLSVVCIDEYFQRNGLLKRIIHCDFCTTLVRRVYILAPEYLQFHDLMNQVNLEIGHGIIKTRFQDPEMRIRALRFA